MSAWNSRMVYLLTEEYIKDTSVFQSSIICASTDKQFCNEQ